MTRRLSLAVPIQYQADSLLPGFHPMSWRFWFGHIFALADLAFVHPAACDRFTIFDLFFCPLTVGALFHALFYTMPFVLVTP